METWNNILNTALLGTDKKQLNVAELSTDLLDAFVQISANNTADKEELFLQITAAAFNYRQCGIAPVTKNELSIEKAAEEERPYCNTAALAVLKDIIDDQSMPLVKYWLQHCNAKQQLVTPENIPLLFDTATTNKKLQPLITACCGKRGAWLSSFNNNWNFYVSDNDEETWQNGTTEQRRAILQKTRGTDAAKARTWLQQTWPTENANTKAELLKQIDTNISSGDIQWLESLLEEKSQKVKDVALGLLKQIPGSSIVLSYWKVLQSSIFLKKEKALLGMLNKTSLQVQLSNFDESLFKTGIEKLSNTKDFTDDEFILYQLIQFVPPQHWELHFNSSPEQVIGYFQKDKINKKFLLAFVAALIRFNDKKWALSFLQNNETFNSYLIPLLSEKAQEVLSLQFFESNADHLTQIAMQRETEWSIEFTKKIFRHAAKNIFQYNKTFYNNIIHLVPPAVTSELEKCAPTEEHLQTAWNNMSTYIIKLLSLKLQTVQAFNLK